MVLLIVFLLIVLARQRFGYKHSVVKDASISREYYAMEGNVSDSTQTVEAASNVSNRAQRTFVYAIQTESCLPIHLEKALGNPTECDCDVLVLSYKKSCQAISLRHVKYINAHSLTWPAGRNLLWKVAKSWRTQYLYYIFLWMMTLFLRQQTAEILGGILKDFLSILSLPWLQWRPILIRISLAERKQYSIINAL